EGQTAPSGRRHPALGEILARADHRPPHLLERGPLEDQVVLGAALRVAEQEGDIFRHVRQRGV
ncbi:hypothetical protein QU38_02070, partial [Staphylococcus aureus]